MAPRCNIKCGYCTRRHDCVNESRPGVTSRILTPVQALEQVRGIMSSDAFGSIIKVVGIAGPGDPLEKPQCQERMEVGGKSENLGNDGSVRWLWLPKSSCRFVCKARMAVCMVQNSLPRRVHGGGPC